MNIKNIDYLQLKRDIECVRLKLEQIPDIDSSKHFWMIYNISQFFYWLGLITLPLNPYYIFSWLSLCIGIFSKWTMIGHHVCHGGYDSNKYVNFNRKQFGIKTIYRRTVDWLDWWLIEAWNIEHNNLHHYYLGETDDPDLIEENLLMFRESNLPFFIKKLLIIPMSCVWKWVYYAPNTYKYFCLNNLRQKNKGEYDIVQKNGYYRYFTVMTWITDYSPWMNGFFKDVLLPYILFMFIIIPIFFVCITLIFKCNISFGNIYCNLLLSEVTTNIYSFIIIIPNHSGEDVYRFDTHVKPKSGEFYLRQIISSVNYSAGNDFIDFLHGWLNYQVEHHIFPDLNMLQYKYAMPLIKRICVKHSIPYIQENVFTRLSKTIDIMIGKTSMIKFDKIK
jgi:fatty acid desaturase